MRPVVLALVAAFGLLVSSPVPVSAQTPAPGATPAPGPAPAAKPAPMARSAPAARAKREPTPGQMAARDRQRKCGMEWKDAKAKGTTGGLKWPQYWSKCNARLKGSTV